MRLGPVAFLLTLCLLPIAAAQVPTPPEPEDAILLACDVAGGIEPQARQFLPCPQEDPAAPAQPDEAAAPPAPAQSEPTPEDAVRLVDDVATRVQEIPDDPEGAPERLQEIVALVVDFVKKVLSVPSDAFAAVHDALADARAEVKDATGKFAASAKGALSDAVDAVRALLDKPQASGGSATRLPHAPKVKAPEVGLSVADLRAALVGA